MTNITDSKDTTELRKRLTNNTELKIFVPGEPQGKGRARVEIRKIKGKLVPHHYTPDKTARYEEVIASHAKCEMVRIRKPKPIMKPVELHILVLMPVQSSWPAWKKRLALQGFVAPTVKPDEDNVKKAVYDAFNGVVWIDDTQVVKSQVDKVYSDRVGLAINVSSTNQYCAGDLKKAADVDALDLAHPEWDHPSARLMFNFNTKGL